MISVMGKTGSAIDKTISAVPKIIPTISGTISAIG
jgi:hypothetical protein